jgi:hypothetical protein
MNACVHTYTKPQTSSTRRRGPGWRIHGSVEDTKLSTNKQHSLSHAPTDNPDRVKIARNGCMLPNAVRLSLSRYCTHQPHPCTVLTSAHHIHTRPPDVPARLQLYQRLLVNTYCTFDLCRPRGRARPTSASCDRRAFALTRIGAGVDLPGYGSGRSDMSAQEDAQGSWCSRRSRTPYC